MRILIIKQLFNPEPTAKGLDFAVELKKRGHQVQVLTGFPSYPLGQIYDGYRQSLWKRENIQGIDIIRVPIYPSHSDNMIKRLLHYLSYALSASILGPFLVKKADAAFVYQGAIPVGIPATIFKWFRGVPFVYDINDLWPETLSASGMVKNKKILRFIEAWCQFNYNRASKITVATQGFRQSLINKGVSPSKIAYVPNWSRDEYGDESLSEKLKDTHFPQGKFHVLYAGNIGVVQALDLVLNTAIELQKEGNTLIYFTLLGGGSDEVRLKKIKESYKLNNVQFIDRVESSEVSKYLNSADVLLVHLKSDDLFEITIPSKILSYLRTGKPILMGLKGCAADIVQSSGSGLLFEPQNVTDFREKVSHLSNLNQEQRNTIGRSGSDYYNKHFSIESSTDDLEKTLIQISR